MSLIVHFTNLITLKVIVYSTYFRVMNNSTLSEETTEIRSVHETMFL